MWPEERLNLIGPLQRDRGRGLASFSGMLLFLVSFVSSSFPGGWRRHLLGGGWSVLMTSLIIHLQPQVQTMNRAESTVKYIHTQQDPDSGRSNIWRSHLKNVTDFLFHLFYKRPVKRLKPTMNHRTFPDTRCWFCVCLCARTRSGREQEAAACVFVFNLKQNKVLIYVWFCVCVNDWRSEWCHHVYISVCGYHGNSSSISRWVHESVSRLHHVAILHNTSQSLMHTSNRCTAVLQVEQLPVTRGAAEPLLSSSSYWGQQPAASSPRPSLETENTSNTSAALSNTTEK